MNFKTIARKTSLACLFTVFAPTVALAAVGFCGNYVQISSNAGSCPTCKLQIADNPEIQKYFVEANNGWSAELTFVEGDASVAGGNGRWKNVGGAYSGKRITVDMVQQGLTLDMTMSVTDGSVPGIVKAKYRCTDPGRVDAVNPPATPKPQGGGQGNGGQASGGFQPASSWGGVVRSGPGMNFRRITSLRQNERVRLVQNTGAFMNGYPWFKIRFRGGRTGYQWGGIICSRGRAVTYIHQTCTR